MSGPSSSLAVFVSDSEKKKVNNGLRGGGEWGYLKVPVEASEGPVLLALVLQEQRALVHSELLQVPATNTLIAIELV